MKLLIAFLSLICFSAVAQPTAGGNFLGSRISRQQTPEEIAKEKQSWEAMQQIEIARELNGHALRKIGGKIYNMRVNGESKHGKVYSQTDGIVVIQVKNGYNGDITYWALKNYPDAIANQNVSVRAIKIGVYDWNQTPLELWDCGTLLTPEEEKQKQTEFESAQIKLQQDRIEAARIKNFTVNSNEVLRLKSAATDGSASAQFSLALHYLNGQGCETNRDLAIHWLKIASDSGYFGASNKLVELEQQK